MYQTAVSECEEPNQQLFSKGDAHVKQKYQGLLLPWELHRIRSDAGYGQTKKKKKRNILHKEADKYSVAIIQYTNLCVWVKQRWRTSSGGGKRVKATIH